MEPSSRSGTFPAEDLDIIYRSPVHYGCFKSLTDAQVQNDDDNVKGHGEHSPREKGDRFADAEQVLTVHGRPTKKVRAVR